MEHSKLTGRNPSEVRREGCRSRLATGYLAQAYGILVPTRAGRLGTSYHQVRDGRRLGRDMHSRCAAGA